MNEHKTLHKAVTLATQVFPGATFTWKMNTLVQTSIVPETTLEFSMDPAEIAASRGRKGFVLLVAEEHGDTLTMLTPDALNPDWAEVLGWLTGYKDSILDDISNTLKICGADFSINFPSRPATQRFITLTDILEGENARLIFVTGNAAVGKTSWVHRLSYDYLMESKRPVHALTGDMTASDYLTKFGRRYSWAKDVGAFIAHQDEGAGSEIIQWLKGLPDNTGLVTIDSPYLVMDLPLAEELKDWAMANNAHVVVTRQARRQPTGSPVLSEVAGVESAVDVAVLLEKDETNLVPAAFMWKDRNKRGRVTIKGPIHIEKS